MLKIHKSKSYPKSKIDSIPVLFDVEQHRFLCCDPMHGLHDSISKSDCFPVNKKFSPKSKQEKNEKLCHHHGRIMFKLDLTFITEDYIYENGSLLVIFDTKTIRAFKNPKDMLKYLKNKNWVTQESLDDFKHYGFLRKDLLDEEEKIHDHISISTNSSFFNITKIKDQQTADLMKLPPTVFDNKFSNKKTFKTQSLQNRRLKDARFFLRCANFERIKLRRQVNDLEIELQEIKEN